MGDSVTDVDACENVPSDFVLSIGFVNERPDASGHSQAFDAVVQGSQGSLLPVCEIVDEIAPMTGLQRAVSGLYLNRNTAPSPAK